VAELKSPGKHKCYFIYRMVHEKCTLLALVTDVQSPL
jgi:hypothetical protein